MDDLFDDVLSDAPTTRVKPRRKFAPKVNSKQGISSKGRSNVNVDISSSTNGNELNNEAAPSTTRLTIEELPNNCEGSFLDTNKSLQVIDNSPEVSLNVGFKSDNDPTSEIPMHEEELTNSADSPTLTDFLQQDGTEEKEDANERKKSLKRRKRSSIVGVEEKGGKISRQTRKLAVPTLAKNSLNEVVEDDDVIDPPFEFDRNELEESDDEGEVDYSLKKKRASMSSKKKFVAENGEASKKRKKANHDLEKVTEEPRKKFPHSSRRRKRCVDKALLENDYLDLRKLPMRDVIAKCMAKKEATTSKTSSTNQSDGDFLHEADANNEEEFFGSDDDFRDPDDDQASEKITSTTPLYNSHSFKDKTPRAKWSKQDTELFYMAISFCLDFTMIQERNFPDKTRRQVLLKFKTEERQHPLRLSDALKNRPTDLSFLKLETERPQQISNKAEQYTARDAPDFMPREEVEDPTPGTNEELATAEQVHMEVEDNEDPMANQIPKQSDDSDDELQRWSQYQSAI